MAVRLFLALSAMFSLAGAAGTDDALGRLKALQQISDWPAVEKECRELLKGQLAPDQRLAVHKALFQATKGDARLAVLQSLPADFPEKEGVKLFVEAIRDSEAYRSLDVYKALLTRYPNQVTADLVDSAARPLLNPRRDWLGGAEEVAKAALEKFLGNSKLLDILAEVYLRTLREKESLELQRQAVANATTPELKKQMYDRLARNLELQGRTDEALKVPYDIVREWPDLDLAREAMDGLALRLLRSQGLAKGLEVYDWYLQTYPKGKWGEHCRLQKPFLHQLDGQYDRAAEEMRKVLPLMDERRRRETERELDRLPSVDGCVLDRAGRPIAGATVSLARRSPVRGEDHLILSRAKTDAAGRYEFRNLPFHVTYEFLAATKPDHPVTGLSTTFGPEDFPLELGEHKSFEIRFGRERLLRLPDPPPPKPPFEDGVARRLLRTFLLREWTGLPWARGPLNYAVELPRGVTASSLRLVDFAGRPVPFQFTPRDRRSGTLTLFTDLPAMTSVAFFLFGAKEETKPPQVESSFRIQRAGTLEQEAYTGTAAFRVPAVRQDTFPQSRHITAVPPPISAVRGPDGVWRGKGAFVARGRVQSMATEWLNTGPLWRQLRVRYNLEGGAWYEATLSFLSGQPYVVVTERCRGLSEGGFRFSAYPGLQPDFAALCVINKLQARALACTGLQRLIEIPRYVVWSPPGIGDAAGFYSSAADKRDLLTTFSVHPGDWNVQSLERWRSDVFGDRSRYWGDPKPGGRDSIEVFEDKQDAYFSYPFFAGERQWGLAVTDREDPLNRAADLRTQVGECTLDWYKGLVLDWDEEPLESHPRLVVSRDRLSEVALALQRDPLLRMIYGIEPTEGGRPYPYMDFLFMGSPEAAWAFRNPHNYPGLVQQARIGKMRGFVFSPVPVRGGSVYWSDTYDAFVNSNLHDPWTWRVMRARMMFLAYALHSGDFMAWRYHAGHRNFDFTRFEVIAALALNFPTHPDARMLVEHATSQFRESLIAFTTEGSGKWEENLGCYYLWSLRTAAAMNARLLNARWRRYDPFDWHKGPLFVEFAVKCITPEHPLNDRVCIDGLKEGQSYEQVPRGRRIPGVGDHGGEGGIPVTDGIGLSGIVAERLGHRRLAADLLGAWRAGGFMREGQAGVDLKGILVGTLDPRAVQRAVMQPRSSENLPGYGFCFRCGWGTPKETFLLFKCGKGGYRYHLSEGSFVFYANNRPLSLDGDENFIPARHATLSIGPQCGYVGNGVIERHFLHPVADYCRGVFAGSKITRSILFVKNDYFVIRDDNGGDESSNFHLPLLVHKIERRGDPIGSSDPDNRTPNTANLLFFCPGRLATDVLLYPLGKPPARVDIKTDPLLNQQLITMTRDKGDPHLNVLQWTEPSGPPLKIAPVGPGYRIEGPDFVDHLFFTAEPVHFQEGDVAFDGRAGLIRQKGGKTTLLLLDGTRIAWGRSELRSRDGTPRAR